MEGQGINGLVIGSSKENPNAVPVKTINTRTWTSIVECISALGVALDPLVIFKAKSIQDQWFKRDFLAQHPKWEVTFSENGWTSNAIAVEWLEKVFLPQTQPEHPDDARLLIVDGHGSHTSDEFMTTCYLNNVYLLFLPAHTSHVLQPLDLGCFSSLKTEYRRQVGNFTALTDETRVGKARFLEFYAQARRIGLSKANIQSGWKATGLYPRNIDKPLGSRWVVIPKPPIDSQPSTSNISTPRRGRDLVYLLAKKNNSPASRISVRKAARALDKIAIEVALRDREIERLKALLDQANPPKRRTIVRNPNDRFINLAQILAQANQEPEQRIRRKKDAIPEVILEDEEGSSESEDLGPVRRTGRDRRPTRRYLERDTSAEEESS
jgi:DDE superfamily endonuclease.